MREGGWLAVPGARCLTSLYASRPSEPSEGGRNTLFRLRKDDERLLPPSRASLVLAVNSTPDRESSRREGVSNVGLGLVRSVGDERAGRPGRSMQIGLLVTGISIDASAVWNHDLSI